MYYLEKKMKYFPVIIIVLVLFACDSVFGAEGLGNLTIEVKKIYKNKIHEKNEISQKSCTKTKDFTLKLENLDEDDNGNIFMCNSTHEYSTVTLTKTAGSSKKLQKNAEDSVCYEIVRESNKNCPYHLRQETVSREQTKCPTEMTNHAINHRPIKFNLNNTKNIDNDPDFLGPDKNETEDNSTLLFAVTFISVFISLAIITFCIFRCYKKVKERKNNEPVYAEPNPVHYAELQIINNSPPILPNRNDPPYAQIVGILTPAPTE